MVWVRRERKWSEAREVKTWVLPARRRKARAWTMRSRSRWKGVRWACEGAGKARERAETRDRDRLRPRDLAGEAFRLSLADGRLGRSFALGGPHPSTMQRPCVGAVSRTQWIVKDSYDFLLVVVLRRPA